LSESGLYAVIKTAGDSLSYQYKYFTFKQKESFTQQFIDYISYFLMYFHLALPNTKRKFEQLSAYKITTPHAIKLRIISIQGAGTLVP